MSRIVFAAAFALLAVSPALGDPDLPEVAQRAETYRESLVQAAHSSKLSELLAKIRRAQDSGKSTDAVNGYEGLIGSDPNNYHAWLKLGLAWRAADKGAEAGASAAWNAYKAAAASVPDQIEALLLLTSILRGQLEASRAMYQSDEQDVSWVKAEIALIGECNDKSKQTDPTSSLALACGTRDRYRDEMLQKSAQVGRIAHDLDEIYTDIATKLPGLGLDIRTMKSGDHRELDFKPIGVNADTRQDSRENGKDPVTYSLQGEVWRACVKFTQDLNTDGSVYKSFVAIAPAPQNTQNTTLPDADSEETESQPAANKDTKNEKPFEPALSVRGASLCIENLPPGKPFLLSLKKGMRSKLNLEMGADYKDIQVSAADIPATVQFDGARFVLPRSGPGLLPVRTTNLDQFRVELFRVTDRTLYRQIALGHLGANKVNLPGDEYQGLLDHFGELLWRGRVKPQQEAAANQALVSLLPVRKLLSRRADWLHERLKDASQAPRNTLSSGTRTDIPGGDAEPEMTGEYFADSSEFEGAAVSSFNPGVYALVTQAPGPCVDNEETPCDRLVQWFVETDIGITFYEELEKFSVALRSLETGEAVKGSVQLVTAGNRVLGEAQTNSVGVATFSRSLTRGTLTNALTAVMAQVAGAAGAGDFAFMAFNAERLDLSKLNVDGGATRERSMPS